ncbi:DUF3592 domain-containing protein [Streptomyces sp. NPDC047971]|uniref:DUF3592 domain-containing protein n=1 Tax=Streptomyces sp. NPDC047971 TaxID=3154499 RepID=UPI0033F1CA62
MNAVTLVLVLFVFVGLAVAVLGLFVVGGPRAELRNMRELERTGVEVPATLVSVAPRKTYLTVVYAYPAADGSRATHTSWSGRNPLHVVGETYPLVRTAHPSENVWMGTMAAVRHERAGTEHHLRFMVCVMLAGVTTCAAAVTGLLLLP